MSTSLVFVLGVDIDGVEELEDGTATTTDIEEEEDGRGEDETDNAIEDEDGDDDKRAEGEEADADAETEAEAEAEASPESGRKAKVGRKPTAAAAKAKGAAKSPAKKGVARKKDGIDPLAHDKRTVVRVSPYHLHPGLEGRFKTLAVIQRPTSDGQPYRCHLAWRSVQYNY